jgi:hypothetical protein
MLYIFTCPQPFTGVYHLRARILGQQIMVVICATLEDWFDPARLRDDYVPTGFKGYRVNTRAVPGHEFGLKLPADDKASLIAFLRTL